jgi:hypothetical protein
MLLSLEIKLGIVKVALVTNKFMRQILDELTVTHFAMK